VYGELSGWVVRFVVVGVVVTRGVVYAVLLMPSPIAAEVQERLVVPGR
jgi:hypothetical protein